MLGGRKSHDVAWVDWFRTTKRVTHALRSRLNLPSLWHRALAAMYGWAGHVARKDSSHPRTRCNQLAKCEMVGIHEKCWSWLS